MGHGTADPVQLLDWPRAILQKLGCAGPANRHGALSGSSTSTAMWSLTRASMSGTSIRPASSHSATPAGGADGSRLRPRWQMPFLRTAVLEHDRTADSCS